MNSEIIYKSGCWDCLKAREDPTEKFVCKKAQQHRRDYEKLEDEQNEL